MKCPYNDFGCTEVDTSGMDKISCEDCKHYNNGVRITGAMPVFEWMLEKFGYKPKKEYIPTDDDIFMMGL